MDSVDLGYVDRAAFTFQQDGSRLRTDMSLRFRKVVADVPKVPALACRKQALPARVVLVVVIIDHVTRFAQPKRSSNFTPMSTTITATAATNS